ncbi:MAG: DUF5615 family PIN-like protein [Candidatus Omnitrophota bacterium]
MRLKLDENLGASAAKFFRDAGHDVETVRAEGLAGAEDRRIISVCRVEKRCLVTLDMDFSNPLVFDPTKYCGIAVLRLSTRPTWNDIKAACCCLIRGFSLQDIQGKLWIVHHDRIREYAPD